MFRLQTLAVASPSAVGLSLQLTQFASRTAALLRRNSARLPVPWRRPGHGARVQRAGHSSPVPCPPAIVTGEAVPRFPQTCARAPRAGAGRGPRAEGRRRPGRARTLRGQWESHAPLPGRRRLRWPLSFGSWRGWLAGTAPRGWHHVPRARAVLRSTCVARRGRVSVWTPGWPPSAVRGLRVSRERIAPPGRPSGAGRARGALGGLGTRVACAEKGPVGQERACLGRCSVSAEFLFLRSGPFRGHFPCVPPPPNRRCSQGEASSRPSCSLVRASGRNLAFRSRLCHPRKETGRVQPHGHKTRARRTSLHGI